MSMIHEITSKVKRNKLPKRKGRGESSGHGKTSGRGNKGSGARSGTYIRRGYEGGQTEVYKRFPKRGFSNFKFQTKYYVINVSQLEVFDNGATVDAAALAEKGLIPGQELPLKILGDGELTKKLTVHAGWYSKSAAEKITKAGGSLLDSAGKAFAFPKEKKKFIPREPVKKKAVEVAAEPAAS